MVSFEEIQAAYYMIAATGVLVAATYYIVALSGANRTRQAQLFMNIYNQAATREFQAAWTMFVGTCTKLGSYEEFNDRCLKDQEFNDAINVVSFFYEGVGVLVKEGLLDIRWIALMQCGGMLRIFWERVKPFVDGGRKSWILSDGSVEAYPRWLSETEYLYDELMKYLEKHPELKT